MPWQGYNFEDSILISERLGSRGLLFTSIHIEEFEVLPATPSSARKRSPGTSRMSVRRRSATSTSRESCASALTSSPATSSVGKITPKGETQLSPKRSSFGPSLVTKAGDVKDTSLGFLPVWAPSSAPRCSAARGIEKDERAQEIEDAEIARSSATGTRRSAPFASRPRPPASSASSSVRRLLRVLRRRAVRSSSRRGEAKFTAETSRTLPFEQYERITIEDGEEVEEKVWNLVDTRFAKRKTIRERFEAKIERHKKGDELSPGVIKLVKVYVAIKRKLQVGDKMAGRHGNKGVSLARSWPIEDMPYLEDGTPGRHGPQPARRSLSDERRSDPRDTPRLGCSRHGREDRRRCSTSTTERTSSVST